MASFHPSLCLDHSSIDFVGPNTNYFMVDVKIAASRSK